jgi:Protein kinase domain/Hsp70 protein/Domain of unknown function (DUF4145)
VPFPTTLPAAFDPYQILCKLGEGGMGAVYLAEHTLLGHKVALMVAHSNGDTEHEVFKRFPPWRWIDTPTHPNLCGASAIIWRDDVLVAIVSLPAGEPLSLHTSSPWSPEKAVALVLRLAGAVAALHGHGLIHGDLTPANVMLRPEGTPVVMDFALPRCFGATANRLTSTGLQVGSPAYLSPEQADGDAGAVGPAADVYSLGVILYELIAGRRPFDAPNRKEMMNQVLCKAPEPPSAFRPGLAPGLDAVCLKALAKKPGERYSGMAEFAAALEGALSPALAAQGEGRPSAGEAADKKQCGQGRGGRSSRPQSHTTAGTFPGHPVDLAPLSARVGDLASALPPFFSEALLLALHYVHQDPASSLTKTRLVLEKFLLGIYVERMGREPRKPLLGDMLADNQFTRTIERRILSRMNAVRDLGNLGPHGEPVEPSDAARALDDLCEVLDCGRRSDPGTQTDLPGVSREVGSPLSELNRRVLAALSLDELRRSLYEVKAYLARDPHSVEGQLLRDRVENAIRREETLRRAEHYSARTTAHPSKHAPTGASVAAAGCGLLILLVFLVPLLFWPGCLGTSDHPPPGGKTSAEDGKTLAEDVGFQTQDGFNPLLREGATLPASFSRDFTTWEDNQDRVKVSLFARGEGDARPLGTFVIDGIEPAPRGVPVFRVTVTVTEAGEVEVEAVRQQGPWTKKGELGRVETRSR